MDASKTRSSSPEDQLTADPHQLLNIVKSLRHSIEEHKAAELFEWERSNVLPCFRQHRVLPFLTFISPVPVRDFLELHSWLGCIPCIRKQGSYNGDAKVNATDRGQIMRWLRQCDSVLHLLTIDNPHNKIGKVSGRPDDITDDYAWVAYLKCKDEPSTYCSRTHESARIEGLLRQDVASTSTSQINRNGRADRGHAAYRVAEALTSMYVKKSTPFHQNSSEKGDFRTNGEIKDLYFSTSVAKATRDIECITGSESNPEAKPAARIVPTPDVPSDVVLNAAGILRDTVGAIRDTIEVLKETTVALKNNVETLKSTLDMSANIESKANKKVESVPNIPLLVQPIVQLESEQDASQGNASSQIRSPLQERGHVVQHELSNEEKEDREMKCSEPVGQAEAVRVLEPVESLRPSAEPEPTDVSELIRKVDRVREPASIGESEPVGKPEQVGALESTSGPKLVDESESTYESDSLGRSRPSDELEPAEGLSSTARKHSSATKSSLVNESESIYQFEAPIESESDNEPDPISESILISESELANSPESIIELDPVNELNLIDELGSVDESESIDESETMDGSERMATTSGPFGRLEPLMEIREDEEGWEVIQGTTENKDWALIHGL